MTAATEAVGEDDVPFRRVAGLFHPYRWLVAGGRRGLGGPGRHVGGVAVLPARDPRPRPARAQRRADHHAVLRHARRRVADGGARRALDPLATIVGQHVMHDLRVGVYAHLQRMSLKFFTKARAGDLQSRLANDIGGVDNVVTSTASGTVQAVLGALAIGIAVLIMNWQLALLCLAIIPLFLIYSLRLGRKRRQITRSRSRQAGRPRCAGRGDAVGVGRAAHQDHRRPADADRALRGRVAPALRHRGRAGHGRPLAERQPTRGARR